MIAENIRNLCKQQGISICALEKNLEIGNGTISRWDKSSPRVNTLKTVADYLGCSIDELRREDNANEKLGEHNE